MSWTRAESLACSEGSSRATMAVTMISPIWHISGSRKPRLVVPRADADPGSGVRWFLSNGMAFLLTVMPISSRSAPPPCRSRQGRDVDQHQVVVRAADTTRAPFSVRVAARSLALAMSALVGAVFVRVGEQERDRLAAMTCISGRPGCREDALVDRLAQSSRQKIRPPRGPRRSCEWWS